MFSKVKEITRKFTPRMGSLKSRDGKVIGDEEGMKNRWKEYSEELYSEDKRTEKEQTDEWDTWSNWNEAGGTKRCDGRKKTLEKDGQDSC